MKKILLLLLIFLYVTIAVAGLLFAPELRDFFSPKVTVHPCERVLLGNRAMRQIPVEYILEDENGPYVYAAELCTRYPESCFMATKVPVSYEHRTEDGDVLVSYTRFSTVIVPQDGLKDGVRVVVEGKTASAH